MLAYGLKSNILGKLYKPIDAHALPSFPFLAWVLSLVYSKYGTSETSNISSTIISSLSTGILFALPGVAQMWYLFF